MAACKRYTYTVTGTYPFPVDMLRYDNAYPAPNSDFSVISMGRLDYREYYRKFREDNPTGLPRFSVRLASHNEPTKDRWLSFGWSVGELQRW